MHQQQQEPGFAPMFVRYAVFGVACVVAVAIFAPTPPMPEERPQSGPLTMVPACDLTTTPCTHNAHAHQQNGNDDASHQVFLDIGPRPIATVTPLTLTARFGSAQHKPLMGDVSVTITSTTMDMGTLTVKLTRNADGSYTAPTALPLCTVSRMQWLARVDAVLDNEAHSSAFSFVTHKSSTPPHSNNSDALPAFQDIEKKPVDFTIDTARGAVSLASLRGKVVLVLFGFTSCPDVCPVGLSTLAAGLRALSDDERARTRVVFISLDPERDTPDTLARYAAFFHDDIIAGTASAPALTHMASAFSVPWQKVPLDDSYVIDHAAFVSVVDGAGHLVGRLAHASPPQEVTSAVRRTLHKESAP